MITASFEGYRSSLDFYPAGASKPVDYDFKQHRHDPEDLRRLFEEPALRERLSAGALEAVKGFSVDYHVDEITAIYHRVAERYGIPVPVPDATGFVRAAARGRRA